MSHHTGEMSLSAWAPLARAGWSHIVAPGVLPDDPRLCSSSFQWKSDYRRASFFRAQSIESAQGSGVLDAPAACFAPMKISESDKHRVVGLPGVAYNM